MITEKDYLEAKKIVQEYESKHLNICAVTNSVCDHPHQKWEGNPLKRICQVCGEDRTKQTGW